MRKDYDTEAMKLVKAVDTAIESFQKFPPSDLTNENVNQVISDQVQLLGTRHKF